MRIEWRAARCLCAVAVVLTASGCGGDTPSPEEEATAAARAFSLAYLRGEREQTCALMTRAGQRQFIRVANQFPGDDTQSCERAVGFSSALISGAIGPEDDIADVRATAQENIALLEGGEEPGSVVVEGNRARVIALPGGGELIDLELSDGHWLVSSTGVPRHSAFGALESHLSVIASKDFRDLCKTVGFWPTEIRAEDLGTEVATQTVRESQAACEEDPQASLGFVRSAYPIDEFQVIAMERDPRLAHGTARLTLDDGSTMTEDFLVARPAGYGWVVAYVVVTSGQPLRTKSGFSRCREPTPLPGRQPADLCSRRRWAELRAPHRDLFRTAPCPDRSHRRAGPDRHKT